MNMKKILLIILLLSGVVYGVAKTYIADRAGIVVDPGILHSTQDAWVTIEPNSVGYFQKSKITPGVTLRTATLFEADPNGYMAIPPEWNNLRIRVSSTTDGDSTVLDMFFMNSRTDHYSRAATLTFTTGSQTVGTSGFKFADTVAVSNEYWHKSIVATSPTGNYIAEVLVDICGARKVGFCATTVTNNAILEVTGY